MVKASPPINLRLVWLLIPLLLLVAVERVEASANNPPASFSIDRNHEQVATLDGLWRFHPGDNPQWADPGFDDSQWPLIRSDKPWNKQGYPHTFGYAWYRFTFEDADGSRPLALLLPTILSRCEIYADGKLEGSAGAATPSRNRAGFSLPAIIQIPAGSAGPRTIHFAIRVWAYEPLAFWAGAGPRGAGSTLGDPAVLARTHSEQQDALALYFVNEYAFGLLAFIAGLTILALFLFHPADPEYLWFSIVLLAGAVFVVFHLMLNLDAMPFCLWRLLDLVTVGVSGVATLIFFSIVLHLRRSLLWWIACIAILANPLTVALIYFQWTSVGVAFAVSALLALPADIWIIGTLAACAIRRDFSARLLLVPVALYYGFDLISFINRIVWQLAGITGNQNFNFGFISLMRRPFPLGLDDVISYLFILALLVFLVRRFSLARQKETRLSNEMEAARTIQSLLVPSAAPNTPRFAVESVYLPANEVGGDFFQIIPCETDGSLLVVAGDISGKGLPAGMLVALLIGTIRSTSETTLEPLEILQALNRRLLGHGEAKATCLALRIEADGNALLANAGHLPPYLNGSSMKMEGALPLGMLEEAEFSLTRFKLNEHDHLVLMSDGIAEAKDSHGKLFGFERVNELLRNSNSAAEVASAAQKFGQEDDISIISITRTAMLTPALA